MSTERPITLREFGHLLRERNAKVGIPTDDGGWEEAVLGVLRAYSPARPLALQVERDPRTTEWPDMGEPGAALKRLEESGILLSGSWAGTRTWIVASKWTG